MMKITKLFPLLFLVIFAFKFADPPSVKKELIKEDLPYLLEFYKTRHQNPEISLKEEKTSKALAEELRKVGIEVTENFGGYGLVGIFKNGEGPTILYRTDMDALPMVEKTNLPYASHEEIEYNGNQTGAMHSCGHDMHMTTLLGTARAMVKMKADWKGTLMLIGQPAEEVGKGSKLMLDAGLYEKFPVPDYGMALHCSPEIPAGQIGLGSGYTMANTESIDIKVYGVGAHGAMPHRSIDPVVIASTMVMELQTIVSRNIAPTNSVVITVGAIKGGTKHNIIPDEVLLQLSVRTFEQETRAFVHKRIKEVARGTAIAMGVLADKMPEVIIPEVYTPANYNDPKLVEKLNASAEKIIGKENVVEAQRLMVGEDFARYGQTEHKVPTALYWLGTVPQSRIESGDMPGLHSPFYYPTPEKTLETGVAVNCQALLDLFEN